jgi:hypothetical protein
MARELTREEFLAPVAVAALVVLNAEPLFRLLGKSSYTHHLFFKNYDSEAYGSATSKGEH